MEIGGGQEVRVLVTNAGSQHSQGRLELLDQRHDAPHNETTKPGHIVQIQTRYIEKSTNKSQVHIKRSPKTRCSDTLVPKSPKRRRPPKPEPLHPLEPAESTIT